VGERWQLNFRGYQTHELPELIRSPSESNWAITFVRRQAHAYSASDVTLAEGCLYSFAPD
jgi:hypothetical protein